MIKDTKLVELLPWTELLDVHLKKDPGQFPLYVSKFYNVPFELVFIKCNKNSTKKKYISDTGAVLALKPILKKKITKLTDFRRLFFLLPLIIYIIKSRKKVSHYILFHATDNSLTLAFFIKLFNPKAKIWLKLDANLENLKSFVKLVESRKTIKQKIISSRYKFLLSKIDLLSAETKLTFNVLQANPYINDKLNIQIIPNGIDSMPAVADCVKKENIIISVATFGFYPKNTELLLSSLESVELADWKVYLIGPIEKKEQDFEQYISSFYKRNPHLKDKIVFVGNISDTDKLNAWYAKAKVFILPSRWEGFSLSSIEAASHLDYLILTDVGAARDLIPNEKYGYILPQSQQGQQNEDVIKKSLADKLKDIIKGKVKTDKHLKERHDYYSQFLMDNIVKKDCIKEWMYQ
ncbi:MAG: glycosyltransferase family 4 protein [Treponema sp.]|nr:glycosyltransferase family 4 protein [Treponema sp.]MEE3435014.1 glycosyltransferase family 4 protein [Treponema sp.]